MTTMAQIDTMLFMMMMAWKSGLLCPRFVVFWEYIEE